MKKVLIITYYWPPAGGPGVQRWLKFVKYLPEFGIEPVVYVPENPTYPIIDKSLEAEIPKGVTIIKRPIFEPYRFANILSKKETNQMSSGIIDNSKKQSALQKFMLYVRGNFFIPDARMPWVKPSVKFLSDYLEKENIDTVITTGPPHSLHLIGLRLQEKLDLKWIADFRDPWTTIGYHKKLKLTKTSAKKHKRFEKEVLTKADQFITTSFKTRDDFKEITKQPITVITNGYETTGNDKSVLDKTFAFSHIGSLLSGRNPSNLWEVFRELIEENDSFRENFRLRLVGMVSSEVWQSLKENQLTDFVDHEGYVSHKEAVEFQKQTQVLLLLEINSEETKGIIPGKLFEYLNAKRPIIAIGPKGWDVPKIISKTESGKCFDYSEKEGLKKIVLHYFEAFQQGNLNIDSKNIQQYHRRELTGSMAEIIKKVQK